MYSSEMVDWWVGRSLSYDYQEAYTNIAKIFPSDFRIFLDVGCGTGEVLKKIWRPYDKKTYLGTDASPKMIEIARCNLEKSGIPVKWISCIEDLSNEGEVNLLLDDISKSKIPNFFADLTSFTFPGIVHLYGESSSEEFYAIKGSILRETVKKTKFRGRHLWVDYDVNSESQDEEKNSPGLRKKIAKALGLKMKSFHFFENSSLWSDSNIDNSLNPGEKSGYGAVLSQRIK
ncbi:MAG TPA: class I SAM-dependent methyltransferase [Candidatus Nanoarchaeia archaeon]|nr:class I SAM-dependent methyltransferase [Candidatus Nanoarchaeia archaeon]